MSDLRIYVQMLSVPGVFPDFICCIPCVTSCSVGTPVAISRSSFGVGGSAVMVADSLFRTSEKCSSFIWFHFLPHVDDLSLLCSEAGIYYLFPQQMLSVAHLA